MVFGLGKRDFGNKISSLITGIFTRNFDRALLILLEKYLCYSRSYEFQDCWSPQGSATIGSFFVFLLETTYFGHKQQCNEDLFKNEHMVLVSLAKFKSRTGFSIPYNAEEFMYECYLSYICWFCLLWENIIISYLVMFHLLPYNDMVCPRIPALQ